MLGEGFHEESVSAGLFRADARGEDAEDDDDDAVRNGVALELATQGEAVELRHQDLGDDDVGSRRACLREAGLPVDCELDDVPRCAEEVRLEAAHVRVAVDDEHAYAGSSAIATERHWRQASSSALEGNANGGGCGCAELARESRLRDDLFVAPLLA